jgi:hypothetical protein
MGLGQSAAAKSRAKAPSCWRSHRVEAFFFASSKLDISTERLPALTPAVVALSNFVTGQ